MNQPPAFTLDLDQKLSSTARSGGGGNRGETTARGTSGNCEPTARSGADTSLGAMTARSNRGDMTARSGAGGNTTARSGAKSEFGRDTGGSTKRSPPASPPAVDSSDRTLTAAERIRMSKRSLDATARNTGAVTARNTGAVTARNGESTALSGESGARNGARASGAGSATARKGRWSPPNPRGAGGGGGDQALSADFLAMVSNAARAENKGNIVLKNGKYVAVPSEQITKVASPTKEVCA